MKKNIIGFTLFISFAIVGGYSTYVSQQHSILPFTTTFDDVEAIAACEVSADDSNNKGKCFADVNNGQEYCVSGTIWGEAPKCSGTI